MKPLTKGQEMKTKAVNRKDLVRVDLTVDEAESAGHHVYDYTVRYTINGAKFKRHFRSGKDARAYMDVLQENGIAANYAAKRHKADKAKGLQYMQPEKE